MEPFSSYKPAVCRCYGYGRVSRSDRGKARQERDESDSITNQRDLIHDYIAQHPDLELYMEGYDDNYTGTNFNRPHFQEMMRAIDEGKIDCIVVKDLSRFGREHIDVGRYLKRFPDQNIRFIAITDGYDNTLEDASTHLLVSVKNLFNDYYCREISISIRSHLDICRRNGKFIGSFAPYGYRKDPSDKNHLLIDDEAAAVVRDIYAWKIEGMSNQGIANRLNKLDIRSPMEYKQFKGVNFGSGYKVHSKAAWSAVAIRRILTDVVYLGVMEQAKRTTPNYKVKKEIQRPPEEWIRVEGTHVPIIGQEDFDLVTRLLLMDTRVAPGGKIVYPLAGLLYCGDCLSSMVRKSQTCGGQTYEYYICGGHKNDTSKCSRHTIHAGDLKKAVLDSINHHIRSVIELRLSLESIAQRPSQKREVPGLKQRVDILQRELEKALEIKSELYRHYGMGDIEPDDFQEFKRIFEQDCEKARHALETQQAQMEAILNSGDPASPWIKYFEKFGRVENLTRDIAVRLIQWVKVFEGGRLEITFRYQEEYERARQFLAMYLQDSRAETV